MNSGALACLVTNIFGDQIMDRLCMFITAFAIFFAIYVKISCRSRSSCRSYDYTAKFLLDMAIVLTCVRVALFLYTLPHPHTLENDIYVHGLYVE